MTSEPAPPPESHGGRRAEIAWTLGAGIVTLALYVATLCPTVYTLDAPELTAAAGTFGVAHPPGYPLFTMLYGALARMLPFGDLALRTNVISAVVAAATVAAVFRCGRGLGASRPAAAAGAVGMAVARDWWSQGVSTEVYALDGLLLALALLATLRVVRHDAPRAWVLLGLTYGLACGHRSVNVVFLLGLLAWVELARRRRGAPIARYGRFVAAGVATATVWLYLPIAASRGPPMNMGDPSAIERLWIVITAAPYARHLASTETGLVLGRALHYGTSIPMQLGATCVAAVAGIALVRRRAGGARAAGIPIAAFAALNLLFVAVFNVPDGNTFLQPTWVAVGALSALGYDALVRRVGVAGPAVALVLAAAPAAWTYAVVDLSGVRTMETYGIDLLDSARPGALVLCYDDNARNAMVYQQVIEGRGRDRVVADVTAPLPWHLDESRRRTDGFDFLDAEGPGWIGRLARRVVVDPSRGLYLTDIEGVDLESLLGAELASRAVQVPAGLLYRIVIPPDARTAGALVERTAAESDAAFWPGRSLSVPARAWHDPQLASVIVRASRPRFLLAVTYAISGRVDLALPHLEALAVVDVDGLEQLVADDLATVGIRIDPWNVGARSRRALEAARSGASAQDVVNALAPR